MIACSVNCDAAFTGLANWRIWHNNPFLMLLYMCPTRQNVHIGHVCFNDEDLPLWVQRSTLAAFQS